MESKWYAFADDFKIYSSGSPRRGIDPELQLDLDLFSVRASWNLKISPAKCVVMRFGCSVPGEAEGIYSLAGSELEFVSAHRDLGVLIDSKMKFHMHIRGVVNKTRGLVNQLLRGTVCRN